MEIGFAGGFFGTDLKPVEMDGADGFDSSFFESDLRQVNEDDGVDGDCPILENLAANVPQSPKGGGSVDNLPVSPDSSVDVTIECMEDLPVLFACFS